MKRINKLILVFIISIICSGCTINYNLEITKDSVKENIDITDNVMENRTKKDILTQYNRWFPAYIDASNMPSDLDTSIKNEDYEYHEKNITEFDNGYDYTYKYTYPIDKYQDSSVLREVYSKRKFYVGNDYIVIKTDKNNLLCNYSYFEKLKVTIKIDDNVYKLNQTNANSKQGNKYIWNFDRTNCNDSEILLQLDMIENDASIPPINNNSNSNNNDNIPNKPKNPFTNYYIYIFFFILILVIYYGYNWFLKFKEKNNGIDEDD